MLVRSRRLSELFCLTQSYFSPTRGTKKKTPTAIEKTCMKPMKYYAVAEGRNRGVFHSWHECSQQVHRYQGAVFKSFSTREEAEHFVSQGRAANSRPAPETPMPRAHTAEAPPSSKRQRDSSPPAAPAKRQAYASVVQQQQQQQRPPPANRQVVYVDGACPSNGKAGAQAGYGGYYGHGDARNFSRRVPPEENQTNNRGEMRAVLHAIQQGFIDAGAPVDFDEPRVPHPTEIKRPLRPLEIMSDSRYTINGMTSFHKKWEQNGFKTATGEPVRNQDLWQSLLAHRDAYDAMYARQEKHNAESGSGITLTHVKGHSNIEGNEMADKLAVQGSRSVYWNVIK